MDVLLGHLYSRSLWRKKIGFNLCISRSVKHILTLLMPPELNISGVTNIIQLIHSRLISYKKSVFGEMSQEQGGRFDLPENVSDTDCEAVPASFVARHV